MKKNYFLLIVSFLLCQILQAQEVFEMIVAKDGSGTHSTLQAAFNAVPANSATRTFIFIKNGKYKEKVSLETNKTNVTLIGQSSDGVIISWDDYSGKVVNGVTLGTSTSQTMEVKANGFYGENLTIENTAGNVGQAVALRSVGDNLILNNCKLTGFQDTHYLHSSTARQYYLNCYIEGATDFMFGGAIGYFDKCTINCVKGGQYITAPADNLYTYGLIYNECTLTANADVADAAYFLGRPWKDKAKTVWLNTLMASFIKPAGWSVWSSSGDDADNHLTGYFAEYNSMNADGSVADVSKRASWGKQLTSEEAALYTLENVFPAWNPKEMILPIQTPVISLSGNNVINITQNDNSNISGYAIIRNNKVIAFTRELTFTDNTAVETIGYTYYVQAVSTTGNLSEKSNTLEVNGGANDITAPSIPSGLKAQEIAGYGIRINWAAATDDESVKGYNIYRDGSLIGSEEAVLFFDDNSRTPGETYSYTVTAYDPSGNVSEESNQLKFTLKSAWLDENFSASDASAQTVPFFLAGEEVIAKITQNGTFVPDRTDYFSLGFIGALRLANDAIFTLPEVPDLEKFSFFAATEQSGSEKIITLQMYDGTQWTDVKSFTVGQGYDASSICEVTNIRSYSPVQLRLYVPEGVVYVRWIKAERYAAGNDPYPSTIPECYTLLEETFSAGIWGTVDDVAAVTKEVETIILGVTRNFKINNAKVMPQRGSKTSGSIVASKGAIAIPKNYGGSLELPPLPNIGKISITIVNGTSDASKAERGVAIEKLNESDVWVEIGRLKATPGGADQLTLEADLSGLTAIRFVNYVDGSGGDVYLQDLKIETICPLVSIRPETQEDQVLVYPNPFTQTVYVPDHSNFTGYELYNISGQLIASGEVTASLDFSKPATGIYILKMKSKDGHLIVRKLSKK